MNRHAMKNSMKKASLGVFVTILMTATGTIPTCEKNMFFCKILPEFLDCYLVKCGPSLTPPIR
jgi:hypothetical protein